MRKRQHLTNATLREVCYGIQGQIYVKILEKEASNCASLLFLGVSDQAICKFA